MALVKIFWDLKLVGMCLSSLRNSLLSQHVDLLGLRGALRMAKRF